MLKVASYDIVFQEIPGEVTLALNLSGCPCHCPGCHSKHLWEDTGEDLTDELLTGLLDRYGAMITCVALMGGDQDPGEVLRLASVVKRHPSAVPLKTAWYSGRMAMPGEQGVLDFVKLGPYVESLGGLKSKTTNQRFYVFTPEGWIDDTARFQKSTFPG